MSGAEYPVTIDLFQRKAHVVSLGDSAYGRATSGSTDDTAQFQGAAAAAVAAAKPLVVPPGTWQIKNLAAGAVDTANLRMYGYGAGVSQITGDATSRLLVASVAYNHLDIHGITFNGFVDVIKSTFTGSGVLKQKSVRDCEFLGFTGTAIQSNTSDGPYWAAEGNYFDGAQNSDTTCAIALSGYTDKCLIRNNKLNRVRIGLKLVLGTNPGNGNKQGGGQNMLLDANEFVHLANAGGSSPRIRVWIELVPSGQSAPNAGQGFVGRGNKSGSENQRSTDLIVVYADRQAGVGTDAGTYWPDLASQSSGIIADHVWEDNEWSNANTGAGTPSLTLYPFVSTSPNLRACTFGSQKAADQAFGAPFAGPVGVGTISAGVFSKITPVTDLYNQGNTATLRSFDDGIISTPLAPSDPSIVQLLDPTGQYEGAL